MHRLLALVLATAAAQHLAAQVSPRPITETDLYAFHWIADPQISPDGSRIVYARVNVTAKHDGYETSLWMIASNGGAERQLTRGPADSQPRWSPDGKMVAFLRAVDKEGKTSPAQLYLLSMDGGEARPLTEMPKAVTGAAWSPNGRSIAFTSAAIAKDFDKKKDEPEPSDVRVITRAVYRSNGTGFNDPDRPSHIWVADVGIASTPQKPRQVTSGEFAETDIAWSPDGLRIYFTSNRVKEPYYQPADSDLYSVSASGGEPAPVASIDGPIRQYALSPDGSRVTFVGALNRDARVPVRSYSQPDLFLSRTERGSTPKNLTAGHDFDIAGGIGGDQAPPRAGSRDSDPVWTADARTIIAISAEHGTANLKRIDTETGKVEALTSGNHTIQSYSTSADASKIAALISTPTNIGDLFMVDGRTGRMEQITHSNRELFSQLRLTEPEMIWHNSFDDRRIQAWVQRPPDFQQGKKYPLILDIHGGPHAAYGYVFDHEFQWMAAKGYVVLYPNPRGSTTYGQEFGNVIQYNYPGDDYKDLMAGVDELIARGWVDPDKLGVTGGSGGGVLTNWVIGHTNRFKAAVSQRSISDWTGFWYTADFALFAPSWFRGAPWEQEADFKARSPISYVKNITTPLLLIEGEADLRTPPSDGGEQMFRALKYLRKPVAMVRFPAESHELSRSGKPTHRVERLQHIVAWFDKYLQGKDIRTFDVQ